MTTDFIANVERFLERTRVSHERMAADLHKTRAASLANATPDLASLVPSVLRKEFAPCPS